VTATSTVAGPLHYRWTDLGDLVTFAEPGADQPSVTVRAPEEYSQATTSIEVEVWQQDQTSARASVTLSFLDEALLATPDSLVLAEVHATWFRVSWDPVDGAASYYATWSDRQGADDWDTSALAEIVVSGLTEQTTYDFQVQARGERDGGGSIWSDFSAPLAITTPPLQLPPPSVNDPVQNPDGSVTLTWDALDGAIEYRVQRALVDQADQFAALASSTEATITDADVAAGTTYFYRVAGVNADLHVGLWSTSVSILVTE